MTSNTLTALSLPILANRAPSQLVEVDSIDPKKSIENTACNI